MQAGCSADVGGCRRGAAAWAQSALGIPAERPPTCARSRSRPILSVPAACTPGTATGGAAWPRRLPAKAGAAGAPVGPATRPRTTRRAPPPRRRHRAPCGTSRHCPPQPVVRAAASLRGGGRVGANLSERPAPHAPDAGAAGNPHISACNATATASMRVDCKLAPRPRNRGRLRLHPAFRPPFRTHPLAYQCSPAAGAWRPTPDGVDNGVIGHTSDTSSRGAIQHAKCVLHRLPGREAPIP